MAQILQERRFGSPYQIKNQDQLRCLLKAKGIQKVEGGSDNTNYDHMTSYRMKIVIIMSISSLYEQVYISLYRSNNIFVFFLFFPHHVT